MFEETNSLQSDNNPPDEDLVSATLAPISADVTSQDHNQDSVLPVTPQVQPSVQTVVGQNESAQARISALNRESMNHRLKRDEYKAELDRIKTEKEELERVLALRSQEVENGKTVLQSEVARIAAEKDAEIERQKAQSHAVQVESLKMRIGLKYRLPESLWPRLQGDTEAEIDTDAAKLKQSLPQESLNNDSTIGINQTTAAPSLKDIKEQRKASYSKM